MKTNIWAIIPAYNEGKTIAEVLKATKRYVGKIVVVDDGSRDSTVKEAESQKVTVLKHALNLGKGCALRTGCDYAVKHGADILVVLDADTQHDPADIPRFLTALKGSDIVFGSRSLDRNMPIILKFGNWFINNTTELAYGIALSDTQSGYRAFTAEAYKKLRWKSSDYSMESEMIANVGRYKLKYREIFIKTVYADKYKGTTVLDGVKIVLNMLRWKITK